MIKWIKNIITYFKYVDGKIDEVRRRTINSQDMKFSKPDKEGVITLLDKNGSETNVRVQTYSWKLVRKLQLFGDGKTAEEVKNIIKQEERERKLKDILK